MYLYEGLYIVNIIYMYKAYLDLKIGPSSYLDHKPL